MYVDVCLHVYLSYHLGALLAKARRHWILCNWSYRWLQDAKQVLGI